MADLPSDETVEVIVRAGSTSSNEMEIDSSGAAAQLSIEHFKVHKGLYFYFQDFATGIGNGATRNVLIVTANNGKAVHCKFSLSTLGGRYTLYEDTTTSANGTAIAVFNRDRTSANTASTTAFVGPTITTNGTQLYVFLVSSSAPSEKDSLLEVILKPGTKYLITFLSTTGSNVTVTEAGFYEV